MASNVPEILKSTSLIGGSTLLNLAIGIARTKVLAMLLGPAGVGLVGLYASIVDLSRSVAGMGISSSGVRQIAEAAGSGDVERISRTAVVLRRVAVALGLLGAAALLLLAKPVSLLSFGDTAHAGSIALLSLALIFGIYADAKGALLQGTRRIMELAKMGVLGALIGTVTSLALVALFGEKGVAPALVAIAASSALAAWWYCRRVRIEALAITWPQVSEEAAALLKLGIAFMTSGCLMMGAAYAARIFVLRESGLHAAGLYQAAWSIGGLYVGFVLQAMATDFYPRLVAASRDNAECNRLVNEQAQVSLLLAGPGVLATLVLAPVVVAVFYTSNFAGAVDVLRWICLGVALRVISWPMGYIIVAQNRRAIFFAAELAWTVFNVGATWLFLQWFGLVGAGVAFFASYVFHVAIIYPTVRAMTGFRWSTTTRRTAVLFVATVAVVFGALYTLPPLAAHLFGFAAIVICSAYSARALITLIPPDRLPASVRRLLAVLTRRTRLEGRAL